MIVLAMSSLVFIMKKYGINILYSICASLRLIFLCLRSCYEFSMYLLKYLYIDSRKSYISKYVIYCLFLLFYNTSAFANVNFYADCVKGYQFSDNAMQSIMLSPLNLVCQRRCESECGAFSRKIKDPTIKNDDGIELNSAIITECVAQCQSGILFKSHYYEAKTRVNVSDPIEVEVKAPVSIASACTEGKEWVANNAFKTLFFVKSGDKIKISLVGDYQHSSKVYLCGKKEKKLVPIFPNISDPLYDITKAADWNISNKQTTWKKRSDHWCLLDLNDTEWSALNNKSLWSSPPWSMPPSSKPASDICNWSARNKSFTNTGIYIRNDDEITIKWSGNYAVQKDIGTAGQVVYDRKALVECMYNKTLQPSVVQQCKDLWREQSALWIIAQNGTSYIPLYGEDARRTDIRSGLLYTPPSSQPADPPKKWYGLSGTVVDVNLKSETNTSIPGCPKPDDKTESSGYQDPDCIRIVNPGTASYTFSGKLEGLSDERIPLMIQHPNANDQKHLGGYEVNIEWGGCVFTDGQRMQYAVMTEAEIAKVSLDSGVLQIPEEEWKDVPKEVFLGSHLVVNTSKSGYLFFRIKSMDLPFGANDTLKDLYENPANRFGKYYMLAESISQSSAVVKDGPITQLLRIIMEQLLGKDRKTGTVTQSGAVYKIFSSIVSDSIFKNVINALIVAYISFTVVGLLIGVVQLSQQDVIKRLAKVGLILVLISSTSWEFFGGYLVPFFVDGATTLIALILSSSMDLSGTELTHNNLMQDPLIIFTIFDGPFKEMFSSVTWKKILGLFLSSPLGLLIVFLILFSMWFYVLTIVKASVMYIFSVIMTSLLIVMGPIFIPMILFKQTATLFKNWCFQLFSFMLQPVMLFCSIAMFNILLLAILHATLGFTVCPNCILYIDLSPLYSACWIPGYALVVNSHLPVGVSSMSSIPLSILAGALTFMLVAHGTYGFCGFITRLAMNIITGSPFGFDISRPAEKVMNVGNDIKDFVKDAAVSIATKGKSSGGDKKGEDVKREDGKKDPAGYKDKKNDDKSKKPQVEMFYDDRNKSDSREGSRRGSLDEE